jgi:hypothetical protein
MSSHVCAPPPPLADVTGLVMVTQVELCSMAGRRPGRFYEVLAAVHLCDPVGTPGAEPPPAIVFSLEAQQLLAAAANSPCHPGDDDDT